MEIIFLCSFPEFKVIWCLCFLTEDRSDRWGRGSWWGWISGFGPWANAEPAGIQGENTHTDCDTFTKHCSRCCKSGKDKMHDAKCAVTWISIILNSEWILCLVWILLFQHEEVQFLENELENQKQKYQDLASFTKSLLSAVRNNDLERQQVCSVLFIC